MLAAIKRAVYIQTVVSRIIDTARAINNIFFTWITYSICVH